MPDRTSRPLTNGERVLAASIFGDSIAYDGVEIRRRKWFPFQPRNTVMAPMGHIHFHPKSDFWSEDFSAERLGLQGLFIHELTHVLQAQQRGRFYLPLMRHPFCRYEYDVRPGWSFERYGLEQQAEIVRHAFLLRNNYPLTSCPPREVLEGLLPAWCEQRYPQIPG